jgi:hypothetical protein
MKKRFAALALAVVCLLLWAAPAAWAAARYSEWMPARNYPNVYHQIVNRSGGSEAEAVRFANQNSHRVKIHVVFTYRPNNTNVGDRTVYLEGGNTYSAWVELAPNVTYSFSVSKD